jgi:SAM-dependent methyltransferase
MKSEEDFGLNYLTEFNRRNGGLGAGTINTNNLAGDLTIESVITILKALELDENSRFIDLGCGLGHFSQLAFQIYNVSLSLGVDDNGIVVDQILDYLNEMTFGLNRNGNGTRPNSTVMFMEGDIVNPLTLVLQYSYI